jgi:nicotinamide-nucleotide amidase
MSEQLHELLHQHTVNPAIAPYARENECQLCVSARAASEDEARKLIQPLLAKIRERLKDNVYGCDDDTLEGVTARLLTARKWSMAIAESCTGGAIAARFVNFPGISAILRGGIVSYSNEAKVQELGVSLSTLEMFGAVSEQAAREMVSGVCRKMQTDVGIAVTGIAGPTGGTPAKPVGLVWAALYIRGKIITRRFMFSGERNVIRQRTVVYVIDWLRRELLQATIPGAAARMALS